MAVDYCLANITLSVSVTYVPSLKCIVSCRVDGGCVGRCTLSSVPIASYSVLNLTTTDWGCNTVFNTHAGVSSSIYKVPTTHQEYIIFIAAAVLVVYICSCLWWVDTTYTFNCLSMDQLPTPLYGLFCPQTMGT